MSRSRSSSTTARSSGGSSGSSSRFGDEASYHYDQSIHPSPSPSAMRKNSDGSSHIVPGSPGLNSTPFNFMSPMIRRDSDSSHSDGGGSATTPQNEAPGGSGRNGGGGGTSAQHASPGQPPLPPPGFQPPIAFNPAAQIFVRQSGGAGGGSSNSGSGNRASSGENGNGKSRMKRSGGGRGDDDRRSSDPATSNSKSLGSTGSGSSGGSGSGGIPAAFRPVLMRALSETSSSSSASSTSVSPPSTIPASPSTQTPMRYPPSPSQPPPPPPLQQHLNNQASTNSSSSSGGNGTNQTRDVVPGVVDPSSSGSGSSGPMAGPGGLLAQASRNSGSSGGTSGGSGGSGGSGSGGGYTSNSNGQSYNGRSQTSLDLISSSVFSANGFSTPLNPPLPQRSNSEAWDSVWPATSPYAVPHLPAVPIIGTPGAGGSHGSSTHSGSSRSGGTTTTSGSGGSGSKASSGSSPSFGSSAVAHGLGSPMGFSLVMSPSTPFPPGAMKAARTPGGSGPPSLTASSSSSSSATAHHKRTPSLNSPSASSSLSGGSSGPSSGGVGRGSPYLGVHPTSGLPAADFDSPKVKGRTIELNLPHHAGGSSSSATHKGSPRLPAFPSRSNVWSPTPSPPATPTSETTPTALNPSTSVGPLSRQNDEPHLVAPADLLGDLSLSDKEKTPVRDLPSQAKQQRGRSVSPPPPQQQQRPKVGPSGAYENAAVYHPRSSLGLAQSSSHPPHLPSATGVSSRMAPHLAPLTSPRPSSVGLPLADGLDDKAENDAAAEVSPSTSPSSDLETDRLPTADPADDDSRLEDEESTTPRAVDQANDSSRLRPLATTRSQEEDANSRLLSPAEKSQQSLPSPTSPRLDDSGVSPGSSPSPPVASPEADPLSAAEIASEADSEATLTTATLPPAIVSPPRAEAVVDNPYFPPTSASPPPAAELRSGEASPPIDAFGDSGQPPPQQDNQAYLSVTEDMDIDDEGLTTLERIFLLSKSEFTHHRIFISRVIGDWVEDVDPCETVEYVLPLLNSLGTDEDESVREALAPSLHKILWFFYSTCRLITEDDDPLEAAAQDEGPNTLTITSEGFDVVSRPTLEDVQQAPLMGGIPADLQDPAMTGPLSGGSSDSVLSTPTSMFSESSSSVTPSSVDASESTTSDHTESTQVSVRDQECYFHTAYDADDEKAFLQPVRKPRPVISVQTFTPLIGSLLMSHSSLVCEAAKAAIIGILARLRNIQLASYEPWPERHIEVGQSKTYYAQTGVHIHDYIALTPEEKKIIQDELLNAIVVGMAKLDETQSPYDPELDENQFVQGDGSPYGYFDEEVDNDGRPAATNGFDEAFGTYGEDGGQHDGTSPELANVPAIPVEHERPDAAGEADADELAAEDAEEAPPVPHPDVVVPQVAPEPDAPALLSPSTAPGNPELAPGRGDHAPSDEELFPETDFDSPNAPPVDHRSYSEVAAYEEENPQRTDPPPEFDQQYTEELSVEASHGRLLSMNLIAAVVECGVLAEEDVATRLFVPEVVRMRFDESYAVRREAALAMAELLKVVSQDVVMDSLLTLFDAFAVDENPHVRQAACLALPALTRHLHPYEFKKEHTLKVLPGFFQDETKEIQNTALEVLGELIYAFHDEEEGLPHELIDSFLGPPRPKKEPKSHDGTLNIFSTAKGLSLLSGLDDEDDYRQIVCAFNFPAVTLTAGRKGWPLLRAYYLELADEPQVQVRRSLAASLHEMAKILGDEIASADLVPFFHRCLEDEYEIRERLWENLHVFIGALDQATAWPLIHKIGQLLVAGQLSNWRLRERLMQSLPSMAESMIAGRNGKYLVVSLLREGLVDKVAAVRDAAIASIPSLYATTRKVDAPETRHEVDEVMRKLANSPQYRQRRTFVHCMETFMDVEYDHELVLQRCIPELLKVNGDPVVDVRFALARYVVRMCGPDGYCPNMKGAPEGLVTIIHTLRDDESFDVRERVAELFPDVEVERRPSAATSAAPSSVPSPRPFVRRTSSTGSAGSAGSIPLNVPMRSPGTPILDGVLEAPESVLQLENVPSPLQSPKVIPGYELHGYAFEESTTKEEALKTLGETQGLGLADDSSPDGLLTPTPQVPDHSQSAADYFASTSPAAAS